MEIDILNWGRVVLGRIGCEAVLTCTGLNPGFQAFNLLSPFPIVIGDKSDHTVYIK